MDIWEKKALEQKPIMDIGRLVYIYGACAEAKPIDPPSKEGYVWQPIYNPNTNSIRWEEVEDPNVEGTGGDCYELNNDSHLNR